MRALITGATGFVGSYLTQLLVSHGENVAVVYRPNSDVWRIKSVLSNVTRIQGDLLALPNIRERVLDFAPDAVFHLAWYGVSSSNRNDEKQIRENIDSSLDLLRLALDADCKVFIGLGSQAEYGPQKTVIHENTPTSPSTMYGTVKLCTYLLSKQLVRDSRMRFAWLRLFSSYGPKDNPDWMIPYLIGALQRREKPALTLGEQQWDYLYVGDVAEAIYLTALSGTAEGVFNLGSGRVDALRRIIEYIRDLIEPTLPLGFGAVPYRPDQVMHLQSDITKLQRETGWKPRTNLQDGLKKTVDWYLSRTGVSA